MAIIGPTIQNPKELLLFLRNLKEGHSIPLVSVNYQVTRETLPLYVMGSPAPHSFTRASRSIVGMIRLRNGHQFATRDQLFEVVLLDTEMKTKTILRNVSILEERVGIEEDASSERILTFISDSIAEMESSSNNLDMEADGITNRMAVSLLEKEVY